MKAPLDAGLPVLFEPLPPLLFLVLRPQCLWKAWRALHAIGVISWCSSQLVVTCRTSIVHFFNQYI